MPKLLKTQWMLGFYWLGFWHWSLGIHFDPCSPNIEIFTPLGFFKLGRYKYNEYHCSELVKNHFYGFKSKWEKVK